MLSPTNIIYRTLHTPDEIAPITDLEMLVWEMGAHDAIPAHMAQVIVKCGGNIIGAYDDAYPDEGAHGRLVGFTLALLAHDFVRGDGLWLWSHMAAVHPDYQRMGIGIALKQAQRDWTLAHGFTRIGWTFDPLMANNAHFNLRLLGATTQTYKINHYGIMTDGLNAGFPSDRFIVEWDLQAPRVIAHAGGEISATGYTNPLHFLVQAVGDVPQLDLPVNLNAPSYAIALPANMRALKQHQRSRARAWQQALAEAFGATLAQGRYRVVDFVRETHRQYYILVLSQ